jgi:hypothetical protein
MRTAQRNPAGSERKGSVARAGKMGLGSLYSATVTCCKIVFKPPREPLTVMIAWFFEKTVSLFSGVLLNSGVFGIEKKHVSTCWLTDS